ncbi:MAG: flavodoxin family protein [Comamonadaceae bacterium]|nr:MAG: flavodoxin family protein [Comamonadaceae bacterium]
MTPPRRFLFLTTSVREPGHVGNTEWLARQAAASLPAGSEQVWHHVPALDIPDFVDVRHTRGTYDLPTGDLRVLFDAMRDATDIVFVSPVYWFSIPAPMKAFMDQWSAWIRIPGVPFKDEMAVKTLWLVTTSGDRAKAQPMIDSFRLSAQFFGMGWGGELWGKGGAPDAVKADAAAVEKSAGFFLS